MDTSVKTENLEPGAEALGESVSKTEADMFSVELKICFVTGKTQDIQTVKVSNVLSLSCVCLTCGKRSTVPSAMKSHVKTHQQDEGILQESTGSTPSGDGKAKTSPGDGKVKTSSGDGKACTPTSSVDGRESTSRGDGKSPGEGRTVKISEHSAVSKEVVNGAENGCNGEADNPNVRDDTANISSNGTCGGVRGRGKASDGTDDKTGADDHYESDTDADGDIGTDNSDSGADSCDEGAANGTDSDKIIIDRGTDAGAGETDGIFDGKGDWINLGRSGADEYHSSGPDNVARQARAADHSKQKLSDNCGKNDSKRIPKSSKFKLRNCSVSMDSHKRQNLSLKSRRKVGRKPKMPHEKKTPLDCSYCGKKFNGKQKLIEHIHLHTGEKPYICSVCGYSYRRKSQLNVHSRLHRGEGLHSCQGCDKQFTTASGLREHSAVHTGEKPFLCFTCGKQFRLKKDATIHMRIHTGEKPCRCTICGKTFNRLSSLKDHMKAHTGEKPHQCSTCGKTFALLATLRDHAGMHGDRSFSCAICGKSYKHRPSLNSHVSVEHHGKPKTCEICGNAFKSPRSLKIHYLSHTKEKPYSCSECGQQFCQKYQLANHARKHTGEKPFGCSQCGQAFIMRKYLTRHVKQRHQEKKPHSETVSSAQHLQTISVPDMYPVNWNVTNTYF